jgi:hypothetical protein
VLRGFAAQAGYDPRRIARVPRGGFDQDRPIVVHPAGALDLINSFITDDGIRDEDVRAFESRGIKVIIAD